MFQRRVQLYFLCRRKKGRNKKWLLLTPDCYSVSKVSIFTRRETLTTSLRRHIKQKPCWAFLMDIKRIHWSCSWRFVQIKCFFILKWRWVLWSASYGCPLGDSERLSARKQDDYHKYTQGMLILMLRTCSQFVRLQLMIEALIHL